LSAGSSTRTTTFAPKGTLCPTFTSMPPRLTFTVAPATSVSPCTIITGISMSKRS